MTRTAFIMIAGKPNVGKSTLLNTLLGEKVAIVSRKPQTTRNRITGVLTKGEDQYVFTDTPGLHKPKTLLGEYMMKSVGNAAKDSDIILFVVEACKPLNTAEKNALQRYTRSGLPVLLVIPAQGSEPPAPLSPHDGVRAPFLPMFRWGALCMRQRDLRRLS